MTSIYCYGDITYEQHLHFDNDLYGNDSLIKSIKFKVGGSAFNTAFALANMDHKVHLICSLGKDIEGEYLKNILYKIKNIKTDFVDYKNINSSKVFALITSSKEHKFLSYRCNHKKLKTIIEKINVKKNDFFNISGYTLQDSINRSICNKLIEKCHTNSGIISIDPSLIYAKKFNKIKRNYCIDYFFPNHQEASIISGVGDYIEAAKILHTKNIKNVLITLGGSGCYFSNSYHKKLYKSKLNLNQSLTIGAGDNFVAGFISAKANHYSIEECIQNANKTAFDYLNKKK